MVLKDINLGRGKKDDLSHKLGRCLERGKK